MDNIIKKVQNIMESIKSIPLSESAIGNYRSDFKEIMDFCQKKDLFSFDYEAFDAFMQYQKERMESRQIKQRTYLEKRKAAWILAHYTECGEIDLSRHRYKTCLLGPVYSSILTEYSKKLRTEIAESTTETVINSIRGFLLYLEESSCYSVEDISTAVLKEYIIKKFPKWQGSMDRQRWVLRNFFKFLTEHYGFSLQVELLLSNSAASPKKVLPCWQVDEIKQILSVIDTSTVMGKRDYAIIILASNLGLRSSDIAALQLSDVDWKKETLTLVQSKTNNKISLPLPPVVSNAIADYILNARPKSDCSHIFLKLTRPYEQLHKGVGRNIMLRYLKETSIPKSAWDGKSFHAFRRTVGTGMLAEGVALSTIAQTLGHQHIDSTKRYLSLNTEMLVQCCMDIKMYETGKVGLS